jgi:chromosome segregation ATPase
MAELRQTVASTQHLLDEDITEIQLTKQEIDSALERFQIDADELRGATINNDQDIEIADSFSHVTYQGLRASIESLVENFYKNDRVEVDVKIGELKANVESIKADFNAKVSYLKARLVNSTSVVSSSENLTEASALLFKKFEYFEEKLSQVGEKIGHVEKSFGFIARLMQNYTTLVEGFDSRLRSLEVYFNASRNAISDSSDKGVENSTNITKIVKAINEKLVEIEAKLERIFAGNQLKSQTSSQPTENLNEVNKSNSTGISGIISYNFQQFLTRLNSNFVFC